MLGNTIITNNRKKGNTKINDQSNPIAAAAFSAAADN
jgi:hypothetical protein